MIAIELGKQNAYDTINKEKIKQIIELASKQKSQLGLAMAYYILGREYTIDQDDSLSYSYLTKAEKIFTAGNDTTGIIHCSKLLRSHTRRADKNLPKFYFDRVVALGQKSKYPIDNYMYYLLIMACDPYFEPQPTESQIAQTLNKTIKMIDMYPRFEYIRANVYKNIQEGYLRKQRHEKVLEFALKVMHHTNKKIDFMDYQYLGNAYLSVKKYDLAVVALEEAGKRIEIERPMALMRRRNIYFFLKKAYYEAGNLKASIQTDETYDSLVSVIRDNDRSVALFHLREKYSFADKEAVLKRLALEKEIADSQKRLLFGGLIMTLVLVGIILFFSIKLQRTNAELLHLQQARDRFYTIIAHDLRSPMNSLNDMGALLHHLISEGKKQELDKVIQQIENMRQQTHLLLNNLFEWGKSQYFINESGAQPGTFDAAVSLQTLCNHYLPFAEAKGVSLALALPSSLPLKADQKGFETAVRNLLDNALKHTPTGGKITVSGRSSEEGTPNHSIMIADTGEGIAPGQLKYLQQVFSCKTKPEVGVKGLGLGMILVYNFAKKNKIKLQIMSESGVGSSFSIVWKS
ncbi:sensor histidine kinase [Runella rosea]|uniref:sensor histidine kinase n=1 Tax=Runella rosea TaxID=2259595 RepID=UPI0013B3BF9B|nr:HAMP domain-containing sensor histidine kinase [Runella rosea]